jgi:hypothetical protein
MKPETVRREREGRNDEGNYKYIGLPRGGGGTVR